MKKGDEVEVKFSGRLIRDPSPWGSTQVSISYLNHEQFTAVVPDYVCRVLEGDEDDMPAGLMSMFDVMRDCGVEEKDAEVATERERIKCSACLRRRMCRMYAWLGWPGIALFFCKECEDG